MAHALAREREGEGTYWGVVLLSPSSSLFLLLAEVGACMHMCLHVLQGTGTGLFYSLLATWDSVPLTTRL